MFLLIFHNNDKKNIKKALMSEDELDDIQGRRAGGGASVCFSQPEERKRGHVRAELKICLSECCLATALLWPIRVGRA